MGFESSGNAASTPTKWVKIESEKNEKGKITAKYFAVNQKVNGAYEKTLQKGPTGFPAPFYGYLTDIKKNLDNKMKVDGKEVPAPKLLFNFVDDENERYVLELPFTNDKGRVNSNVFSILNSLASIKKFGYLKVYLTNATKEDGSINFTLNIRNDENWKAGSKAFERFKAPKEGVDATKVSWKYEYNKIPPVTVQADFKGKMKDVDNSEEHQQFFLDLIDNEISPLIKDLKYETVNGVAKAYTPAPAAAASTASSNASTTSSHEDEDASDLPF